MITLNKESIIALSLISLLGFLYVRKNWASIKPKVDITSHENLAYGTFTEAYKETTGSQNDLGSDIYDLLHGNWDKRHTY